MYLSPFRQEMNASFSVDYDQNVWYDHGIGEGGSIIDLTARIENCTIGEAISRLEQDNGLSMVDGRQVSTSSGRIEIRSVGSLEHPALVGYLRERNTDIAAARKYCQEVLYSIGNNDYFAIGFKNDAGGWELRNPNFKGSSTPKNITTIQNGSDTVMVFEGFMDFLSYLSLKENPSPTIDTTVLNSVTNLTKSISFLQSHRTVHAFFDNDEAGRKALDKLRANVPSSEVVDQSVFYRNHKDLNDYWRQQSKPKPTQKVPAKEANSIRQRKLTPSVRRKGKGIG